MVLLGNEMILVLLIELMMLIGHRKKLIIMPFSYED